MSFAAMRHGNKYDMDGSLYTYRYVENGESTSNGEAYVVYICGSEHAICEA
jgi:hypothetical protein